jgi:hypothetical protein
MRAPWVCLSVSLPRQCVNYKKPRDDVHTHTESRWASKFYFSTTQWQRGERKTGVSLLFLYLPRGCAPPCVCVCVICIFFRKGGTIESLRLFSLPSRRALFYMISFSFLSFVKSHQDAVRACLLILFLNLRSSDSFLFISSAE